LRYHINRCLDDTKGHSQQFQYVHVLYWRKYPCSVRSRVTIIKVLHVPDAKPGLGAFGRVLLQRSQLISSVAIVCTLLARKTCMLRHIPALDVLHDSFGISNLTSPATPSRSIPHCFMTDLRPLQVDLGAGKRGAAFYQYASHQYFLVASLLSSI